MGCPHRGLTHLSGSTSFNTGRKPRFFMGRFVGSMRRFFALFTKFAVYIYRNTPSFYGYETPASMKFFKVPRRATCCSRGWRGSALRRHARQPMNMTVRAMWGSLQAASSNPFLILPSLSKFEFHRMLTFAPRISHFVLFYSFFISSRTSGGNASPCLLIG